MDRKTAETLYDSGEEITVEWLLRLDAKIDELAEKVAKLSKNSSNSSKSPSSDITKPQGSNREERRRNKKKNKHGAQWGHQKWELINWDEDQVYVVNYDLNVCPHCAGPLQKLEHESPRVLQQVELVTSIIEKTEHRGNAYWCPRCKCVHSSLRSFISALRGDPMSLLMCWVKSLTEFWVVITSLPIVSI